MDIKTTTTGTANHLPAQNHLTAVKNKATNEVVLYHGTITMIENNTTHEIIGYIGLGNLYYSSSNGNPIIYTSI